MNECFILLSSLCNSAFCSGILGSFSAVLACSLVYSRVFLPPVYPWVLTHPFHCWSHRRSLRMCTFSTFREKGRPRCGPFPVSLLVEKERPLRTTRFTVGEQKSLSGPPVSLLGEERASQDHPFHLRRGREGYIPPLVHLGYLLPGYTCFPRYTL